VRRTTFVLLCLEGGVLSFSVAATAALVPSIAREFALSQFLVGAAVWLYMLPYGISALLYGPLIRRCDAKTVELWCFALFLAANVLCGLAPSIEVFLAGRFLMGVFGASVIPLAVILIAQESAAQERGKQVGIFFGATFTASLAGLLLSGLLPWRWNYLLPAVFGVLVWIHIAMYMPRFPVQAGDKASRYLHAFGERAFQRVFAYIFLVSLIYHGVQQWLGVYFSTRFGWPQLTISLLVTLTSLSGIFGEVLGGFMADWHGRRRTIALGAGLMAVSAFLLVFRMPVWCFALVMLAWGAGWTFNHAGVSTVLTDMPQKHLHEAASLNSSVRFLAGGLGAACAGLLLQRSFETGFFVLGALLLALVWLSGKFFPASRTT
jgi:predicted MFS family arabinose efflux permease